MGRCFDKIMPPKKVFHWTDDEVELLLNVTYEYKTASAAECTDLSVSLLISLKRIHVLPVYTSPKTIAFLKASTLGCVFRSMRFE